MTAHPPRDVRTDAQRVLARVLRNAHHIAPEHLSLELLAALDGAHLGLTDTTPPVDPNADYHRPANPGAITRGADHTDYQAARKALRGDTATTTQEEHPQ